MSVAVAVAPSAGGVWQDAIECLAAAAQGLRRGFFRMGIHIRCNL